MSPEGNEPGKPIPTSEEPNLEAIREAEREAAHQIDHEATLRRMHPGRAIMRAREEALDWRRRHNLLRDDEI